jgi:hypothetical protein
MDVEVAALTVRGREHERQKGDEPESNDRGLRHADGRNTAALDRDPDARLEPDALGLAGG